MSRSDPLIEAPMPGPESRNSAAAVMQDDFARMSEEEREFLRELARSFIDTLNDCEKALAKRFEDQLFDLEEGNAFWSLLPAKVRTAIKRGSK